MICNFVCVCFSTPSGGGAVPRAPPRGWRVKMLASVSLQAARPQKIKLLWRAIRRVDLVCIAEQLPRRVEAQRRPLYA